MTERKTEINVKDSIFPCYLFFFFCVYRISHTNYSHHIYTAVFKCCLFTKSYCQQTTFLTCWVFFHRILFDVSFYSTSAIATYVMNIWYITSCISDMWINMKLALFYTCDVRCYRILTIKRGNNLKGKYETLSK